MHYIEVNGRKIAIIGADEQTLKELVIAMNLTAERITEEISDEELFKRTHEEMSKVFKVGEEPPEMKSFRENIRKMFRNKY